MHFDPVPPAGDPAEITLEWTSGGQRKRIPIEQVLWDREKNEVPPSSGWVYTGSRFWTAAGSGRRGRRPDRVRPQPGPRDRADRRRRRRQVRPHRPESQHRPATRDAGDADHQEPDAARSDERGPAAVAVAAAAGARLQSTHGVVERAGRNGRRWAGAARRRARLDHPWCRCRAVRVALLHRRHVPQRRVRCSLRRGGAAGAAHSPPATCRAARRSPSAAGCSSLAELLLLAPDRRARAAGRRCWPRPSSSTTTGTRGNPWRPLVMGACRGLVYCVARRGGGGLTRRRRYAARWLMTVYVAGLTVVAKRAGASARWLVPVLIAGISIVDAVFIADRARRLAWLALVAAAGLPADARCCSDSCRATERSECSQSRIGLLIVEQVGQDQVAHRGGLQRILRRPPGSDEISTRAIVERVRQCGRASRGRAWRRAGSRSSGSGSRAPSAPAWRRRCSLGSDSAGSRNSSAGS